MKKDGVPLHVVDVDKKNELVKIKVLGKCNLEEFALVDRTFDGENETSNSFRHILFFPRLPIGNEARGGDTIEVKTATTEAQGKYTITPIELSQMDKVLNVGNQPPRLITIYWSGASVWNNDSPDTATIIKFSRVHTYTPPLNE